MLISTVGTVPADNHRSPAMCATAVLARRPAVVAQPMLDRPGSDADRTGFEIGWDHAHHRLVPPAEHLHAGNPVRQGWEAGQAVFGTRTLQATPQVRKWLQLRLGAWLRGKAFEPVGVTPAFLKRISVPVCPITGGLLTQGTGTGSDASVDRVNNRAGYAVGNLAVMSTHANRAKSEYDWEDAVGFARQIERGGLGEIDGLTAHQWSRLAVLMSFCTPLPHAQAAALPLLVLPPARLRVLNPAQVLQLLLTLRFMQPGQPARADRLAALFPPALRTPVLMLMVSLLSRRISAGTGARPAAVQRAMEAAWAEPAILRRWQAVAAALTAAQCERIVERLVAHRLAPSGWRCLPVDQATEGWALETAGRAASSGEGLGLATDQRSVPAVASPSALPTPVRSGIRMRGGAPAAGVARLR